MSSWLQRHFFTEQCGFKVALGQIECQLEIIKPAPFRFSPDSPKAALSKASLHHIPVISSEALSGNMYCGGYNSKEIADRLTSIAPEAKILILYREQKSLIRSLYKSWINWGMPHSIEEVLSPNITDLAPQFRLEYLEFDHLISYYHSVFGRENVLALPYEGFLKTPYIQLRKIHSFSGCDPSLSKAIDKLPLLGRVNKGQSLSWLYWIRWQNRYLYKTPFDRFGLKTIDNDSLIDRISRNKKNRLPSFTDPWFEKDFRETVSRKIGSHYRSSNRRTSELSGINLSDYGYDC